MYLATFANTKRSSITQSFRHLYQTQLSSTLLPYPHTLKTQDDAASALVTYIYFSGVITSPKDKGVSSPSPSSKPTGTARDYLYPFSRRTQISSDRLRAKICNRNTFCNRFSLIDLKPRMHSNDHIAESAAPTPVSTATWSCV